MVFSSQEARCEMKRPVLHETDIITLTWILSRTLLYICYTCKSHWLEIKQKKTFYPNRKKTNTSLVMLSKMSKINPLVDKVTDVKHLHGLWRQQRSGRWSEDRPHGRQDSRIPSTQRHTASAGLLPKVCVYACVHRWHTHTPSPARWCKGNVIQPSMKAGIRNREL